MGFGISLDNFEAGNLTMSAFIWILDADNGVDVGIRLLNDFWQVMDLNGRIMEINLKKIMEIVSIRELGRHSHFTEYIYYLRVLRRTTRLRLTGTFLSLDYSSIE